ncbi:ABC transporter permease [Lachnoclostridium sp. An14]|uniref:ABC transporter permease n=1 Tax=Lachnoclostridium sp. An14 TaxID=1965562 RepID=UPI000B3AF18E|nr:ABC transporter permease [Lachnoclostridium sp. An14]OUQ14876.1 ABC transporter permease [Lachnoclostridium sp. An14]
MNQNKQGVIKRILSIRGMGGALTAFAGLIVIYIAFGIINPKVFAGQNVMNLLRSMSKYLIIGIGQSYVLITGNIDLSIGSVVGMSAMISATLMCLGVNPVLAVLITLACCMVVGVINGFLVGKCKLPPFIATLGTMFVARGIAYMVNGNRNTDAIASGIGKEGGDTFQNVFYYGKTLGIYNTFWIAILLFVIFFFLLSKTRTGRHIYAIGSNVEAAKLSGVNVVATTTKTYLVSAFCSFVVGLILCGQAGMGNMEAGNMYEMYAVAAGVIGGISPLGGTGLLLGTLAGASVWQTLENGLNMIGAQVGIQRLVIGIIVVFAVLLDVVFRKGVFGKRRSA